jgi:hypothetical protein
LRKLVIVGSAVAVPPALVAATVILAGAVTVGALELVSLSAKDEADSFEGKQDARVKANISNSTTLVKPMRRSNLGQLAWERDIKVNERDTIPILFMGQCFQLVTTT